MHNMAIRKAVFSDKPQILEFCKNTFSWGDYISEVWDYWLKEGNFLVSLENNKPIAICHAFLTPKIGQIWIEGIRVHPTFRKQGHARNLVKKAEAIGRENNCKVSLMLIEVNNIPSLQLATSLKYQIYETWYFYSLEPKNIKNQPKVKFADNKTKFLLRLLENTFYVKSWRFLPLDSSALSTLVSEKKVVFSTSIDSTSIAILCKSEHFEKILLVTLYPGNNDELLVILSYLQSLGFKKYKRIQILTKKELPHNLEGLKKKLTFYLLKKNIQEI